MFLTIKNFINLNYFLDLNTSTIRTFTIIAQNLD